MCDRVSVLGASGQASKNEQVERSLQQRQWVFGHLLPLDDVGRKGLAMSVFSNTSKDSAEDRSKYAPAILDLLGNRVPMDVLRGTPDLARSAIAGLTAGQLRTPEMAGKWSIAHVLRHLADSEVVWGWRMRLILAQDRPPLTGYDQDQWADRLHYADADAGDSIDALRVLRRDNLKLIERATPEDMQRVGVHSERGEESAGYLMHLYAGHDLLHLSQIDRIKAAIL
jgi:uncharacterized damage-inducible protein DinB